MITSQPVCATRAVRAPSSSGSSGILTARLISYVYRRCDGEKDELLGLVAT